MLYISTSFILQFSKQHTHYTFCDIFFLFMKPKIIFNICIILVIPRYIISTYIKGSVVILGYWPEAWTTESYFLSPWTYQISHLVGQGQPLSSKLQAATMVSQPMTWHETQRGAGWLEVQQEWQLSYRQNKRKQKLKLSKGMGLWITKERVLDDMSSTNNALRAKNVFVKPGRKIRSV